MPASPGATADRARRRWHDGDVREPGWALVVPVKRLSGAKSRLRGAVPGVPHERLALALAQDTVAAAVACPAVAEVLVITPDQDASAALAALGALVEPEPASASTAPDAGLNAAVAHGLAHAAAGGRRVAVLTADLPALRADDLAAALAQAADAGPAYVADAAGTGTTLLVAPADGRLEPRFGPGSARAHEATGARPLSGPLPTLRRDVDTPADLAAARALGLGRHTRALVGRAGSRTPATGRYGACMQGTVATYDAQTRSGTLLLDDGSELAFPAAAFEASGLRLLRLGQRVRVERDGTGQVVLVTLPTL
jgi:2-phospho-L-lactate guanylyltransferase